MKDARYLIRVAHPGTRRPIEQRDLLAKVRALVGPHQGKAINLRVSPAALEFDLFIAHEADVQKVLPAFETLGDVITCKRLDLLPGPIHPQKIIDEARQLFNEHRFWEVHEVLEGLWKELQGSEKNLVQGLILAAASLVHAQKDEESVMWTMLADALQRLDHQPETYYGWDVRKFRDHLTRALASKKLDIPTV